MASPPRTDRQRRGQQTTEHPDQHQKAQRDGQRLHQQQVALVLTVDLVVDHRRSAGANRDAIAVVHNPRRDALGIFLRAVLAAFEVRDDQPGFAVLTHQVGGQVRRTSCRTRPRRDHVVHPGRPLHLRDDVGRDAAGLRALRAGRGGQHDDELLIALAELVGQQLDRLRRLCGRILKAAGGEALGHRDAEDRGRHHDQDGHRENAPRGRDGEAGNPLQHACPSAVISSLTYQR